MKLGVLQFFSWPGRRIPLEQVYARAFERIDIMDRGGFDCVWLAEHHFSDYSVCPSVHLMAMHIAGRTSRLRIGTAVSLAPFYQPLRLAEEVALLDVLSGGRVNWGVGRGFDRTEYDVFGVQATDSYELFRENVQIVVEAWRSEKLTYSGRFHQFEEVEVLPKPLQDPHPPVWLASTSEESVQWAAANGFNILMDPHASRADLGAKYRGYLATLAMGGHDPSGRQTPMARLVAVANTAAEAEAVARAGARWTTGSYVSRDKGHIVRGQGPVVADPVERYVDEVIVHGTPEMVADQLLAMEDEFGLHYLMAAPLSHESFLLLADEVLPRIAS